MCRAWHRRSMSAFSNLNVSTHFLWVHIGATRSKRKKSGSSLRASSSARSIRRSRTFASSCKSASPPRSASTSKTFTRASQSASSMAKLLHELLNNTQHSSVSKSFSFKASPPRRSYSTTKNFRLLSQKFLSAAPELLPPTTKQQQTKQKTLPCRNGLLLDPILLLLAILASCQIILFSMTFNKKILQGENSV